MKRTQRFERNLADAQNGNDIEVLKAYDQRIREQKTRQNASRNAFVRTCCQQEIEQLTAERNAIEYAVVG